jgi:hypothetical protein
MSLATTSQDVSTQNNQGVACIENGDLPRALHFFRAAFRLVKVVAQHQQIIMDTTDDSCDIDNIVPLGNVNIFLAATACASKNAKSDMMENANVYTQVFRMVVNTDLFAPDTLEAARIRSAIVIFNLALAMHLQSMRDGTSEQGYLAKAQSLYQHSFHLLSDRLLNGSTGNALLDLLYMAVLNNLAQITLQSYSYHQEEKPFNQILGRLVRFARTIQATTYRDMQVSTIMTHHVRSFLLNAATSRFLPQVSAAAA